MCRLMVGRRNCWHSLCAVLVYNTLVPHLMHLMVLKLIVGAGCPS